MTVWVESARPLLGQSWHPLESFRAEGHRWSDNQRGGGRSDGSRDLPAIAVNEKDAWALWSKPASVHSTSAPRLVIHAGDGCPDRGAEPEGDRDLLAGADGVQIGCTSLKKGIHVRRWRSSPCSAIWCPADRRRAS